jgi:hypothetical protein
MSNTPESHDSLVYAPLRSLDSSVYSSPGSLSINSSPYSFLYLSITLSSVLRFIPPFIQNFLKNLLKSGDRENSGFWKFSCDFTSGFLTL